MAHLEIRLGGMIYMYIFCPAEERHGTLSQNLTPAWERFSREWVGQSMLKLVKAKMASENGGLHLMGIS